jgi:hypothetical protein
MFGGVVFFRKLKAAKMKRWMWIFRKSETSGDDMGMDIHRPTFKSGCHGFGGNPLCADSLSRASAGFDIC